MTTQDAKNEKPQRKKYTWEVVTRAPRGTFRIGDREFIDQPFTRAERRRLLDSLPEGATMLELMVAALNQRHAAEHQTVVTVEWVDEQLSDEDLEAALQKVKAMAGVT